MNTVIAAYRRRKMQAWMETKTTRQLVWHLYRLGHPERDTYISRCANEIRAEIQRREVR